MAIQQNQPVMNNSSFKKDPITQQPAQQNANPQQNMNLQNPTKWYGKWWVWAIIVAVIILIGGLAWFLFSG